MIEGDRFLIVMVFVLCMASRGDAQKNASPEAHRQFDRGMAFIKAAATETDYVPAAEALDSAVHLAPAWPDAWFNLAMVREKMGEYAEAIDGYRQYIALLPTAPDADAVRKSIARLTPEIDGEVAAKCVYLMMASGLYRKQWVDGCAISGDEWVLYGPYGVSLGEFRMNGRQLQVRVMHPEYDSTMMAAHPGLRPPIPEEWKLVRVAGSHYAYSYYYYAAISFGYVVRSDVLVSGVIISADPPRVKEHATTTISWGIPIPGDSTSMGRPWIGSYRGSADCTSEWKLQ